MLVLTQPRGWDLAGAKRELTPSPVFQLAARGRRVIDVGRRREEWEGVLSEVRTPVLGR